MATLFSRNVVLHAEKMKNQYFDIEWMIDLIKEQEPDRTDLVEQLENSDKKKWIRQPYIHFVSGARPNHQVQNGNLKRTLFWNMKVKEPLSSTFLKTVELVE